jgi:hypothetical protein
MDGSSSRSRSRRSSGRAPFFVVLVLVLRVGAPRLHV